MVMCAVVEQATRMLRDEADVIRVPPEREQKLED